MEDKDFLDGWREENFGSYAGGCEYDPMVEAILAYERMQKEKEKKEKTKKEDEDTPIK